eukprot:XP_011660527.1 PREDICTED: uncharacterized protein LOC105436579 [Strongylocentrotus purpuratus]
MPDHVQRLRTKLRARYIEEFSEVKVSPMDPESRTWLQHIFVSLILMLGCIGDQEQPIEYENLFSFIQTKTKKGFITRVAFLGEAGVGKSTLFAKIALDWAMGKCLQDITVLFHESFRDIEDSPFFGNIVMNHFPDDTEIIGEWIDKYIKENQRKVLILLDGMDEAKMDIKNPNRKLAIVSIVRRESFIDTSVLISTRPFGADQIKSIQKIHEKYCYIQVKGFTKENRNKYIKQYFNNDRASASSLIHFMNTNSVVSEYMAPFPIFCCMLCYMWKVGSKRETTENLQAVSQLMKEMDFALREQYSSRYTDNEEGYQCHMEKAAEAIVKVGCVAFEGLLKNQFIFTKDEMKACDGFAAIACHVGILSGEKRLASRKIRQRDRKQFIQEFSFPHKLLQEHSASLYIASLYNHSRSEFNRILTHKLIKDYRAFKYVLYFTAAHGGEVGKSVLEALCKKVDDMEFIIRAAFECHDSEAIDPFRNLLKTKAHLVLFRHIPFTTLAFTLETMGKEVVRRSSSIRESLGVSRSLEANASSSHEAAVGLFTLQDLRHLDIMLRCLDDEFYTGMSAAASQSKVSEMRDVRLVGGPTPDRGTVELRLDGGTWETTRGVNLDINDVIVICRQLGFAGASRAITDTPYGQKSFPIRALIYVRLVGGPTPDRGTVELRLDGGTWETTRGVNLDINDVIVICRQLGFAGASEGYLGCFVDESNDRVFPGDNLVADPDMTISYCIQFCNESNRATYKYAGVENGDECYCGKASDNYSRHGVESDANWQIPCSEDPTESCGGTGYISIFEEVARTLAVGILLAFVTFYGIIITLMYLHLRRSNIALKQSVSDRKGQELDPYTSLDETIMKQPAYEDIKQLDTEIEAPHECNRGKWPELSLWAYYSLVRSNIALKQSVSDRKGQELDPYTSLDETIMKQPAYEDIKATRHGNRGHTNAIEGVEYENKKIVKQTARVKESYLGVADENTEPEYELPMEE